MFDTSKRKKPDLAFPFARETRYSNQQDVIDCQPNRDGPAHFKNAGHWFAVLNAFLGEVDHGSHIVSQKNTALCCGPFENIRIVGTGKG